MAVFNYRAIVEEAEAHVGLHEVPHGSNDGTELRKYLSRTHFKPGEPWCMYFVMAVLLNVFETEDRLPKSVINTGSCQENADVADKVGRLGVWPATGCIFVLPNDVGHFHHAGIITDIVEPEGIVHTIEGNTNADGSVEGFIVAKRARFRRNLRFITW